MNSPLLKNIEFGGFKARVEQARAQAASVAKTLQNLDEMAEDDEYIKSEGLNVKTNVKKQVDKIARKDQIKQNEQETTISRNKDLDLIQVPSGKIDRIYDKTAHSSSTQNIPSNSVPSNATDCCNAENARQEGFQSLVKTQVESLPTHERNFYVHESVTALMRQADIENDLPSLSEKRTERKTLRYLDSDDDYTSSDDDSDDEIMDALVRSRNREEMYDPDCKIMKRKPTSTRDDSDCPPVQGKKDPNRFFADLDAHLSSDYKIPLTNTTSPSPTPNLLGSFVKQGQSIDWLRNVVSPRIQLSIAKLVSDEPLGDENDELLLNKKNDSGSFDVNDDERIDILESSAIFGEDESIELERLEQMMKKSYMRKTIDALFGNRYIVYIFLPFLLTSLAYFMTRKKTDDSVT